MGNSAGLDLEEARETMVSPSRLREALVDSTQRWVDGLDPGRSLEGT